MAIELQTHRCYFDNVNIALKAQGTENFAK